MIEIPKHIHDLVEGYVPLDCERQIALVRLAKGGDQGARDDLVLSNLRFVLQEIRSLPTIPIRLEFADLFDAGVQGMLEALDRFDITSGNNFLTYAFWWIKKRILQTIYDNLSVIHIPKAQIKQLEKLHALCEQRAQRVMSCPNGMPTPHTAIEMAQDLFGEDKKTFYRLLCAWEAFGIGDMPEPDVGSLDLSVEDTHQQEMEFFDDLDRYMHLLTDREEDIVKRHFGIGCAPQDYESIGVLYILTPERIRQLVQGALTKIKENVLPTEFGREDEE